MDTIALKGATLVFDLDGTLVDTAPDLVRTLNHVLASAGSGPRALEEVRPFISFGARRMIVEGLAAAGKPASDAEIDALFSSFLEHYADNVAVESRPYPGAVDVLEAARSAGARLALCTNKTERLTRLLLGEIGMTVYFDAIAGRDTLPVCKPDPRHLTGAIAMAGGETERAIMVGDSATDVNTAKAAGVPCIAVSFGYADVPAADLGADHVISHFDELPAALARIFA
jgi:phosphoglycolate phosphatase